MAGRKKGDPAPPPPGTAIKLCDAYGIDKVCADIIGGTSMTAIAKSLDVSIGSFLNWLNADSERSARVTEARRTTAKLWDELATETIKDAPDAFELSKAKELAHHYRWRASKIAPREYGDKIAVGGADDLPPIKTMSDDELAQKIALKMALLKQDGGA